jgi:hypothetical protein
MALFLFVAKAQVPAGAVERVLVCSPFVAQANVRNQMGQVVQAMVPDKRAAFQFASQNAPMCPNVDYDCYPLSKMYGANERTASVLCSQTAAPAVTQQYVQSAQPVGQPVGNPGHAIQPQRQPGQKNEFGYEELPDAALPATQDAVFGDIDGAGGTFTDIDSQGNEVRRQMSVPIQPPVQQRVGQ